MINIQDYIQIPNLNLDEVESLNELGAKKAFVKLIELKLVDLIITRGLSVWNESELMGWIKVLNDLKNDLLKVNIKLKEKKDLQDKK